MSYAASIYSLLFGGFYEIIDSFQSYFEQAIQYIPERWYSGLEMKKDKSDFASFALSQQPTLPSSNDIHLSMVVLISSSKRGFEIQARDLHKRNKKKVDSSLGVA